MSARSATRINLLPSSYVEASLRRREVRFYALLLVLAGVISAGWWKFAQMHLEPLRSEVSLANQKVAAERARQTVLTAPHAEFQRLRAITALRRDVSEPLPMTLVTSLLSQLLPDRSVLNRLVVDLPPLAVEAVPQPGATVSTGAPKAPPEIKPVKLELLGLSKTDGDVARAVNRLADHPLFAKVNLVKSKQVLDGGPPRVGFTINLEIPLNRKFILPALEAKEGTANAY